MSLPPLSRCGAIMRASSRADKRFDSLVDGLAATRIGGTFNQYAEGPRAPLLRARLAAYLESRRDVPILLVGEAAGYRGARVSGIPFTSERQLTGSGPAEATATIAHRVLAELALGAQVLLWNVVPTHPGSAVANRRPTAGEIEAGLRFLEPLAEGRLLVAVGRVAGAATGAASVRHPSHGGARPFADGLASLLHSFAGGRATASSLRDEDLHREAGRDPA